MTESKRVFLAAGGRTPFTRVDGALAKLDVISASAHVLKNLGSRVSGNLDGVIWGSVAQHVAVSNLAREAVLDAGLSWDIPAHSVVMACSTSMVASFDAAGFVARGRGSLFAAGGVELMSRVQVGLTQGLSDTIRRVSQAKNLQARFEVLGKLRGKDIRLDVPRIANRVTGKSMGEHQEETNKVWKISREDQDLWSFESHKRAVAAQDRGFFKPEIIETEGTATDAFPRRDSTIEKLAKLKPSFDKVNGTITAGSASPLTDGAAGIFVASEEGLARLPAGTPAVELVDYEVCAVDSRVHGLLMAPSFGMPRLLGRNGLKYEDVRLYEIHEAFASQVLVHMAAWENTEYLAKFGVDRSTFGRFPKENANPNGGSVALGHPFAATGARILSQAVRELVDLPGGSYAIVSICADGGLGTIALLRKPA
ncbi:MAG: acetyl-CoA C-acyltransferase [Archangium gephyra]|uniref:Acetyl-CoA C-acyltransferase n=1 Tax=Archangium gephyra TaxID=48 RepID=A0A2W5SQY1_9BACT|nr:MAG: acetyl-CoA C-acyltransferase [Archangium gephyra]